MNRLQRKRRDAGKRRRARVERLHDEQLGQLRAELDAYARRRWAGGAVTR